MKLNRSLSIPVPPHEAARSPVTPRSLGRFVDWFADAVSVRPTMSADVAAKGLAREVSDHRFGRFTEVSHLLEAPSSLVAERIASVATRWRTVGARRLRAIYDAWPGAWELRKGIVRACEVLYAIEGPDSAWKPVEFTTPARFWSGSIQPLYPWQIPSGNPEMREIVNVMIYSGLCELAVDGELISFASAARAFPVGKGLGTTVVTAAVLAEQFWERGKPSAALALFDFGVANLATGGAFMKPTVNEYSIFRAIDRAMAVFRAADLLGAPLWET